MADERTQEMNRVLGTKSGGMIFKEIISHFGLSVNELTEKVKLSRPEVSRNLSRLKKAELIKFKLVESPNGGIEKRVYPSMKWSLRDTLKLGKKEIIETELDNFENFFFMDVDKAPRVEKIFSKYKGDISFTAFLSMVFIFIIKELEDLKKEKPDVYLRFETVNKPLVEKINESVSKFME